MGGGRSRVDAFVAG
ncbi:hypothetical protein VC87395_000231A, partial [Vibrio paracholerae 87395]